MTSATADRPTPHHIAYSRLRRAKTLFRVVRQLAALGPAVFERSKSAHLGPTYGLDPSTARKVKARYRNELSFGGDGK